MCPESYSASEIVRLIFFAVSGVDSSAPLMFGRSKNSDKGIHLERLAISTGTSVSGCYLMLRQGPSSVWGDGCGTGGNKFRNVSNIGISIPALCIPEHIVMLA
jgi:hypothetical protein